MHKLKLDLGLIDRSLAQGSFADFVRQAWPIVEPATPLIWNWHLDVLAEYLEAVAADDGIKRLIVNIPPRSGKSLLASVLWPAWVWAKSPATRWLFASYSVGLSGKHSSDRRTVITSPWYQRRWPVHLLDDQNQKTEFVNTARGHMLATSLGGTATGKGGDFLVADDLQNPEMAESTAERRNVLRFFDETLSTRLDSKRHGRILVIQQRTHQADLTGHLLEQGGWTHLCLPAEFERRTVIALPSTGGAIIKGGGRIALAGTRGAHRTRGRQTTARDLRLRVPVSAKSHCPRRQPFQGAVVQPLSRNAREIRRYSDEPGLRLQDRGVRRLQRGRDHRTHSYSPRKWPGPGLLRAQRLARQGGVCGTQADGYRITPRLAPVGGLDRRCRLRTVADSGA
jgi:hypothetical protein